GGTWLEVVMTGRTAHGSLPHLGANAVAGLAEALVEMERGDALQAVLDAPEHPLLGVPTLTPTRIQGGVANNVVPDRAVAALDIRTLPGQSHVAIHAALRRLVEAVATRRQLRAELVDLVDRAALETSPEHPLVRACADATEAVLGRPAELCGLTGATDATELVPPLGLPFVICGPGQMAQAHQPDEWVDLAALDASVEIYLRLARALCA
ncbi:MAG: M20 family metallopeptidase, partial [Chloroflexota bacterium]